MLFVFSRERDWLAIPPKKLVGMVCLEKDWVRLQDTSLLESGEPEFIATFISNWKISLTSTVGGGYDLK